MCSQEKERTASRPLWIKNNVMRLIMKKRRVWRWYSTSGYTRKDHEEYLAYKNVQDQVKKAVRLAKRNFERKLAKDSKRNPKAFYGYIKKKTGNRETVGPLKDISGNLVSDDRLMAEQLNSFFCLSSLRRAEVAYLRQRIFFRGKLHLKMLRSLKRKLRKSYIS